MTGPVIVQQFGDRTSEPDGSRGPDKGMYDNSVWQCVLDISPTPNKGPSREDGLQTAEAFAMWLKDHAVDVVIWTMWMNAADPARLKAMCPDLKIIGLTDHPLSIDFTVQQVGASAGYIHKMGALDAVMTLTPREQHFYGGLHANAHYVGLPFPWKSYERFRVERDERTPAKKAADGDEIVVGLSVGGPGWSHWDRNNLTTALCFRQFVRAMKTMHGVNVRGVWLSWTYPDNHPMTLFAQGVEGSSIQHRTEMETYLATLQGCDFVFSNIIRDTPGRLVAECAWAGVPLIGSRSLSLQEELMPQLAFDPYDISGMVEKALWMCSPDFGNGGDILDLGQMGTRLQYEYGYVKSRERFCGVLDSIGIDSGAGWETV